MIFPDKLERYKGLVCPTGSLEPDNTDVVLGRLLSTLTPDPMGIVLAFMDSNLYSSGSAILTQTRKHLRTLGLPGQFPVLDCGVMGYFKYTRHNGVVAPGALVKSGVVRELEAEDHTYFQRNEAGCELAVPLVQRGMEFVEKARALDIAPRYVSMGRIFRGGKPGVVFNVVRFLVDNPGEQSQAAIAEGAHLKAFQVRFVTDSLGEAGIINHDSPSQEKEGKRQKGWAVYHVINPETVANLNLRELFKQLKDNHPSFSETGYLTKTLAYMQNFPERALESNNLSECLGIPAGEAGRLLSYLKDLGILDLSDHQYQGKKKATYSEANDTTRMLYEIVLQPALDIALNLSPLPLKAWNARQVGHYLQNYLEERVWQGPQGGASLRNSIINVLAGYVGIEDGIKLSHLHDDYSSRESRALTPAALLAQVRKLMGERVVEKTGHGFYRLRVGV